MRHPAGRHGELRLTFTKRDARTVLSESHSRAPLQVMKPLDDGDGRCVVYLLSPTGGVMGGDRYEIDARVEAGCRALLTTQAATKVYRMTDGDARLRMSVRVEGDAVFEYLPDPTILFADSDYAQEIEVSVADGGKFIGAEIIMPGRLAR
ncbi:MAG: urease accessory protein UreD, partial [Candidatus Poribacteria bacterium]|nr:urease accessory protein UreD [Candidatus Poribacteria bacterium]